MRILDTDTCIELLRGNPRVLERREAVEEDVATTWISAAELYFGAARSREAGKNRRLVDRFLSTLEVLGLDASSAALFGDRKASLAASGQGVPDADLWIASIAIARDAVVVTGNTDHLGRVPGVTVEDWIR